MIALPRIALAAAALMVSASAPAQLFRAYLASDGSDTNPCTLVQPCRLLPAAMAAVADGGQVWILDSANFNMATVTISKSVSILAVPGAVGSVVAAGGPAISISGAVKVSLRNLVVGPLAGAGGTDGISISGAGELVLDGCVVSNHASNGIRVNGARVLITETRVLNNQAYGLLVTTVDGGARVSIARSTFARNGNDGVRVATASLAATADIIDSVLEGNGNAGFVAFTSGVAGIIRASIAGSQLAGNATHGVLAQSVPGQVRVAVKGSVLSNNVFSGVQAVGADAKIWLSGNTVSGNATGLQNTSGVIESAGNNDVRNNTTADKSGSVLVIPME